jgi:hypothetical protein
MTSCVHTESSVPGCAGTPRLSSTVSAVLLMAAIVSSMVVVANRLMSTTGEGALLVAWVVLWGVVFVGLAWFAGTARAHLVRLRTGVRAAVERRAAAHADQRFMADARLDPRVFSELTAITTHRQAH